ncbi:MAG: potassium channel family protein, partial [Candidatus Methylomirabilales bacterium]
LFADRSLAAEVNRLEDRLDDMREALEAWVLDAALEARARPALRGLLHLAVASESIGDAAQSMVWLIERNEELHPIIAEALGEAEDVVLEADVEGGSAADGKTLDEAEFPEGTGMTVLAILRGGRWQYRPTGRSRLQAGDRLVLIGPSEALDDIQRLLRGQAAWAGG